MGWILGKGFSPEGMGTALRLEQGLDRAPRGAQGGIAGGFGQGWMILGGPFQLSRSCDCVIVFVCSALPDSGAVTGGQWGTLSVSLPSRLPPLLQSKPRAGRWAGG